ncbi:MAG: prevent-host-death protein [Nevskia sp.]|nr:prevent-host-death protein [Nevskia sp.]
MKTTTIPSLRVEAELRQAAESVLHEGETLSSFVEQSLKANILRRQVQKAFIEKGLAAREEARRSGKYLSAEKVLDELDAMLKTARRGRKGGA